MNWYTIYTKAGKERFITERLSGLADIEVLNPIIKVKKFLRGRLTITDEELFPSYIFAKLDVDKYYRMIKYTRGVRRLLGSPGGSPYVLEEDIITKIKERIVDGYVRLDPPDLRKGDKVYIKEGPLKGFMGVFLEEAKPSERVTILLNTLSYQGKVEVDKFLIRKDN